MLMRLEAVILSLLCLGHHALAADPSADSARGNTAVTPAAKDSVVEPPHPYTPAEPAVVTAAETASADAGPAKPAGVNLTAPGLTKLELGGTVQLKAFYHNFAADRDADKSLSYNLRRLRIDLDGAAGEHFGFTGQFRLDANGKEAGIEAGYLSWTCNDLFGVKGGKIKRPFSQEALMSSKSLYTIERGPLYQNFLETTTGYSAYDLGVVVYGGFEDDGIPVKYEVGLFNGKQNEDPVAGYKEQQAQTVDQGLLAKDIVFRLSASPFKTLKAEAGVSTKAAEDKSDPGTFGYAVNTAYEAGLDFELNHLRLLGEFTWGDNHMGQDSKIISGSGLFVAFYGMGVWHEDYSRGRASEVVLKLEGLDPDARDGHANDGKVMYTAGINYFFTPHVSLLLDYGVLQPVTEVAGQKDLRHDLDAMWRMSF
jgi:hypothetical protein